jgi:hypothetical protein
MGDILVALQREIWPDSSESSCAMHLDFAEARREVVNYPFP